MPCCCHLKIVSPFSPSIADTSLTNTGERQLSITAGRGHSDSASARSSTDNSPGTLRDGGVGGSSAAVITPQKPIPYVIKWRHGGANCVLLGSFNNWKRIPMVKSSEDFSAIVDLLPGRYEVKFVVDDEWRFCPDMHKTMDVFGNVNNVLVVKEMEPSTHGGQAKGTNSSSPGGGGSAALDAAAIGIGDSEASGHGGRAGDSTATPGADGRIAGKDSRKTRLDSVTAQPMQYGHHVNASSDYDRQPQSMPAHFSYVLLNHAPPDDSEPQSLPVPSQKVRECFAGFY